MKLSSILSICALLLAGTSVTQAEEWVVTGGTAKPAQVKVKEKLIVKVATAGENLLIDLTDGKQKFGSFIFQVKNGENIYLRPRLQMTVPLEVAKGVKAGAPLVLTSFAHTGGEYVLSLVDNPDSDMPNAVLTSK